MKILSIFISSFILNTLLFSQLMYAQGWVSFFKANAPPYYEAKVIDLFEMDDGNFMSSGIKPGIVMLNAVNGDTLWTSNIAQGQAVRTTDGGFMFNKTKINANFEVEWAITASVPGTNIINEIIQGNEDSVYYACIVGSIILGDAPIPMPYNTIWFLNSSTGTYQNSVNILALPVLTLDNWAAGENNDMVPLLDGNGWMVFAQCNFCHGCFIKVTYPFTFSQSCLGYPADTRSIIHTNEGDGYIVTIGYPIITKVDLNGNIIWSKEYQTTTPPVSPDDSGFHNIISTGAEDGYIAVGKTDIIEKLWVVKTDNNGNLQWQSDQIQIKNYRTVGRTILKTSDGGYLIGGVAKQFASPYDLEYPFFVKMDSTGNCRPQAAFTHSLNNYTLSIESNTSTGAHEYTWLFGNSDTAQTATPVYTYPNPGTYNLCLVATNPCGNDTLCTQIDVATGIHSPDNPIQPISLYPNPVSANQNIFWQAAGISTGAALELRVFNLTGNILYREQPNQPSGILPSHTWPPGLYFLQLITPNSQTTVRLVVSGR